MCVTLVGVCFRLCVSCVKWTGCLLFLFRLFEIFWVYWFYVRVFWICDVCIGLCYRTFGLGCIRVVVYGICRSRVVFVGFLFRCF